jgi:ABC-type sulfate/molybdate transport systems ATPase subunit
MMSARDGAAGEAPLLQVHEVVVDVPGWTSAESRRRVLNRVSLELPAASVMVVTGAARFGGTTLARVVAGLVVPTSGTVVIGGRDVSAVPAVRRPIGFVPAGGGLLPHLTATENIVYGLRLRNEAAMLIRTRVADVVERLELGSSLDLRPHELSPGQRMRTALARAAVGLAPVLVIDATGGAEAVDQLRPMVERIRTGVGPAVLLCTNRADLLHATDRVVRLHDGTVVLEGAQADPAAGAAGAGR